jgi:hypothetical protein
MFHFRSVFSVTKQAKKTRVSDTTGLKFASVTVPTYMTRIKLH